MTLAAGTKLGRYEIRAQTGEVGRAEVYLAEDTKLDRRVAHDKQDDYSWQMIKSQDPESTI